MTTFFGALNAPRVSFSALKPQIPTKIHVAYACHFEVDVEGWRITIYNDYDELDYCERCVSPDGQRWDFDPGDRTDPIALLSTWEHQSLECMLKALYSG